MHFRIWMEEGEEGRFKNTGGDGGGKKDGRKDDEDDEPSALYQMKLIRERGL